MSCDRESTLSFSGAIRKRSSIQVSLAKSRNRLNFVTPQFGKEAQTEQPMVMEKKPERRTKSNEAAQFENELERIGVIGATSTNSGSNCDTMEEAQTKRETEEVEIKRSKMETGERTKQPMGERFPLEQPMAKERVLKEYEPSDSGVTCQRFRREVPHSLPD